METTNRPKILFVCHANSVRSQMAEGWARHLAEGKIEVKSAGLYPGGPHPAAIDTMLQAGIDISGQDSREVNDFLLQWADYVITCANTVENYYDYAAFGAKHTHWPIINPDDEIGAEMTESEAYGKCRDEIKRRVENLLGQLL